MFCKYCGKQIADDAVFCPFCGKSQGNSSVNTVRTSDQPNRQAFQNHQAGSSNVASMIKSKPVIVIVAILAVVLLCILIFKPSGGSDFSIEGKWVNTSSVSCGQIMPGGVLNFNGSTCNFISPMDTYAFYKNGNKYYLSLTVFFSGDAETWEVKVKNKNNITITDGGNYTLTFERAE